MRKNLSLAGSARNDYFLLMISCGAIMFLFACKNPSPSSGNVPWSDYVRIDTSYPAPDPNKQLVVWLKPGSTGVDFKHWLDSVNRVLGNIQISNMCNDCDDSLFMITGPGAELYIMGQTAGGGSGCTGTRCGPSGEDGPVLYSINFDMESNDYIQDSLHFADKTIPAYTRQPVVVGIFDTGIDPLTFNSYFYSSSVSSCVVNPGANTNSGWNFVSQNSNWADDYPSKHGTQVTGFVVDQSMKFRQNSVNILPIKIHDHNGHAGLFNVLCAFAYASNRGARIINASFGYYAAKPKPSSQYPDSCALLIKAFVKKYTTDRGILLIAAAGNSGNTYEDTCRAFVGLDKRNLDQVGFYPASLGADTNFRNVMAVTTVDTRSSRVSPRQNYSPNVVDIGVQADTVDGELFLFIKPRLNAGFRSTVEGSSFATPIVTGIIASHYFKLDGLPADKSIIIATLRSLGLAESNPAFVSKIKNGIIMHK